MEPATLTIACQGAITVSLDELSDLQGNLKDLTEDNYVKLRNSMMSYGFSFPIFVWIDSEGKKWILDAHQRVRTLRKMQSEGYTIPPLPADIIHADSKTHAKQKLLLLNSRYGKMSREGYDEFIAEPGAEINDELEELLVLPEIQMWEGNTTSAEEQAQTEDHTNPDKIREITCPNCQHKFTLFDKVEQ